MGWIEQTTRSAYNALLIIAALLIVAAFIAAQLRMGYETSDGSPRPRKIADNPA
jgi:hypothetical protein